MDKLSYKKEHTHNNNSYYEQKKTVASLKLSQLFLLAVRKSGQVEKVGTRLEQQVANYGTGS